MTQASDTSPTGAIELDGSDEPGIRRTLASYCHNVDDCRFTELVDLFAPDGCFVVDAQPITGRTELRRFFEERQGRASSADVT